MFSGSLINIWLFEIHNSAVILLDQKYVCTRTMKYGFRVYFKLLLPISTCVLVLNLTYWNSQICEK